MFILVCIAILVILGAVWLSDKKEEAERANNKSSGKDRMERIDQYLAEIDKKIQEQKSGSSSGSGTVGNGKTNAINPEIKFIIDNTCGFVGMCNKLENLSSGVKRRDIHIHFQTAGPERIEIIAEHTFHDVSFLQFAYNAAQQCPSYESATIHLSRYHMELTEKIGLTAEEMRSFQDLSDFWDVMRGGIPGYNTFVRSGYEFTMTQKLGSFLTFNISKKQMQKTIVSELKQRYPSFRLESIGGTIIVNF